MKAIIYRKYKSDKEIDLSEVVTVEEVGMDTSIPYDTKVIVDYGDEEEVFKEASIVSIK